MYKIRFKNERDQVWQVEEFDDYQDAYEECLVLVGLFDQVRTSDAIMSRELMEACDR